MKTPTPWWKNTHHLMMLGCALIMGYALFDAADIDSGGSWLSILLLLACPLMHLLMMKGMGHSCHKEPEQPSGAEAKQCATNQQHANEKPKPTTQREF